MDLLKESQLMVFALLRCRLLRAPAAQALVSLLLGLDRACCVADPSVHVHLDSDHLGLARLHDFIGGSRTRLSRDIATGTARHGADAHATVLPDRRVDPVNHFVLTALLSWDVLHVFGLVAHLALLCISLAAILIGVTFDGASGWCVTVRGSPLDDSIARTFLRSLLSAAQRLRRRLDGPVRATPGVLGANCNFLYPVLASTGALRQHSSLWPVARLCDRRSAHANFRGSANDRTGRYESFRGGLLGARRVDELLLDDGSLVAGPHVGFLRADAATWVRPHVFNLTDITTVGALDVVQDYS